MRNWVSNLKEKIEKLKKLENEKPKVFEATKTIPRSIQPLAPTHRKLFEVFNSPRSTKSKIFLL